MTTKADKTRRSWADKPDAVTRDSLTVGKLRKILDRLSDDTPITIFDLGCEKSGAVWDNGDWDSGKRLSLFVDFTGAYGDEIPCPYREQGYDGRDDYLQSLADDYGMRHETVRALADLLGPCEDFDGLVSALDDLG